MALKPHALVPTLLVGALLSLLPIPCEAGPGVIRDGDFIRVAPDGFTFSTQTGKRFLPMGAYYFDERHSEIDPLDWWDHVRPENVRKDMAMARRVGCNALRITLYPTVEDADTDAPRAFTPRDFEKCDMLLAIARENGLRLYIGLRLKGYPIQDARYRPLYVSAFSQLAARYRDDPTVFCWELDAEGVTLVGYAGDKEEWLRWLRARYGTDEANAAAWGMPADDLGWREPVWNEWRNALHHHGRHDDKRDVDPTLWYLDGLNRPNSQVLYDWQLFREHLYTSKVFSLAEVIRANDPNHLITLDLIIWAFPLVRNQTAAGWGGPYGYAGIDVTVAADYVDFLGLHTYPMYIPPFTAEWYEDLTRKMEIFERELRYVETCCRFARVNSGLPVVHSETGWHGGEGDYVGNTEEDQKRWCLAVLDRTRDCAVGWINWTLKDVPTHEGITAYGGLVTRGITLKDDVDDVNPLSQWLYAGELPEGEAQQMKAWGRAFAETVDAFHQAPDVRPEPGTRVVLPKRFVYTATVAQLDAALRYCMDDARFPCDIVLEALPWNGGDLPDIPMPSGETSQAPVDEDGSGNLIGVTPDGKRE
jgi:hypothetical protein